MRVHVTEDYETLSAAGADLVAEVITRKPDATLILATGNSPMGMYAELAKRRATRSIDTSRLRIFQLDAYLGIEATDDRSLFGWMKRTFLDPMSIPPEHVVSLPGNHPNPAAVCAAYEEAIRAAGGIDLSILGLGPNGHLGFNEPPVEPDAPTRVVDLTEESIQSNATYWGGRDRVPRRAMTAGMNVLLAARSTVLLVSGEHKRGILDRTVNGPQTPQVPASFLQRAADVTILADRAAWPGVER